MVNIIFDLLVVFEYVFFFVITFLLICFLIGVVLKCFKDVWKQLDY